MKPTAPGSSFSYICLAIYFFLAFIFRYIKPKIQKIPCCNLFVPRYIYPIYKFTSRPLTIVTRRTLKGIDNPFNTSGCEVLFFMCRGCLRCVAWFSYWFDNLGFISEGNTYHRYAASSLPLWVNTNVASSDIKRNFWRRCQGASSTYTRFLITNLIYLQFTLFAICLSFSSPPLHKNLPFYSPSFSFVIFSPDLFSCAILLALSLWLVLPLLLVPPRMRFLIINLISS